MKRIVALALVTLFSAATFAQYKRDDPRLRKAIAEAEAISVELSDKLKSMLAEELASGSFAGAVKVCSETALTSTEEFSRSRGRYVRRVTLQTRNPKNAPDDFERDVLRTFARVNRSGGVLRDYFQIVDTGGGQELRFLRPVQTGGVCLSCHGPREKIPAEVKQILRERYPHDQATGYSGGEVRGAISVRIPLAD